RLLDARRHGHQSIRDEHSLDDPLDRGAALAVAKQIDCEFDAHLRGVDVAGATLVVRDVASCTPDGRLSVPRAVPSGLVLALAAAKLLVLMHRISLRATSRPRRVPRSPHATSRWSRSADQQRPADSR